MRKAQKYKPVHVFPYLHNIEDFLDQNHPVIPPDSQRYDDYWVDQLQKSLEGKWGHDYNKKESVGGFRWMPGGLYFHTNLCTILLEGDYTGDEVEGSPRLRDIDWLMSYAVTTCEGFSGFKEDKKYSCFRPLYKVQNDIPLEPKEEFLLNRFEEFLKTPDNKWKQYVDARSYLYSTFDEPMGQAMYLNEAQNLILLGPRGFGKSWFFSNAYILHEFVFDGAKSFSQFAYNNTSATCYVAAPKDDKLNETLDKLDHNWNRLMSLGSYQYENGDFIPGYFSHPVTGRLNAKYKGTFSKEFRDSSGQIDMGNSTKIAFNTLGGASGATAGVSFRAKKVLIDEAGLIGDKFEEVHGAQEGTKTRETKIGMTAYTGTGGDMKKVKGIKKAYYNPREYAVLPYEDVYSGSKREVACFVPATHGRLMFKDENGNTDIEKAFKQVMIERESKTGDTLAKHITYYPLIPDEIFNEQGDNNFPTEQALTRRTELEQGVWEEMATIGKFHYVSGSREEVVFAPDIKKELKPIVDLGDEDRMDGKLEGAVVMYEPPSKNKPDPSFTNPMYIVVYDPIKDPEGGTSLCSAICFKFFEPENAYSFQFNIVCEWYGRYDDSLAKNHEVAIMMAKHYGAKLLPEINNKDIVRYLKQKNEYSLGQPRPGLSLDGTGVNQKDYDIGIKMTPGLPKVLELYLKDLMLYPVDYKERIVEDQYVKEPVTMISQCPSIRFLSETIAYNPERKQQFDAVSSMMLTAVIVREFGYMTDERDKIENVDVQKQEKEYARLNDVILQTKRETRTSSAFNY